MRTGTTLPELIVALSLFGMAASWSIRVAGGWQDGIAVGAARETLISELRGARVRAQSGGGASVEIVLDSALVRVRAPGAPDRTVPLGREHGVTLSSGATRTVRLQFDRMGLGRFASRSVTVSRGRVSRSISISSYGRVRRN